MDSMQLVKRPIYFDLLCRFDQLSTNIVVLLGVGVIIKKSPIADMSAFFQIIGKSTISKKICEFLTLFCALLTPFYAF